MSGTSKLLPVPTARKLIAAVMLVQIFLLLLRSWLQLELTAYGISDAVSADLSYLVVFPLMALFFYPILRQFWSHLCSKLKLTNLSVKAIAIGIGVGLALRFTRWGVVIGGVSFGYLVDPNPGASAALVVRFGCPPYAVLILSLFVMAFLIPVVEEVINRGLLLEWLLKYGRVAGLILSSVLFAMMHRPEAIGSCI
ncbi:MAG: CPBP family intramembrane glutamic endopeptidase [Woeseiaceae bacterium]|nr:CPBP family intramembrane glutamic endopeptidase [Woeseiaceae bacterium]